MSEKYSYMFSVAVITYNQENTIRQTLDSILSQKHDYPYEIVIGDDCSKDSTAAIIREYHERYPDIIHPIFNDPNLGAMKNYYNVLDHCEGKYVMDCAGDDYWLEGKVEKQIPVMEADDTIWVSYGKARMFDEKENSYRKRNAGNGRCSFEQILLQGNPIPSLTSCVRADRLREYLDQVQPLAKGWALEDLPMWLYMSKYGRICFIDEVFGVYRIVEGSTSHDRDAEKIRRMRESQYEAREYFVKDDPVLQKKIKGMYHQLMAVYSLETGNKPAFRKHALQAKDIRYAAMALMSYTSRGTNTVRKALGID